MKLDPSSPFLEYTAYKNFHRGMNRWQVCLVPLDASKKRKTITYAKYLISVANNRVYTKDEHIDHINGDKTDDRLSNLQVLTPSEHQTKTIKEATKPLVNLVCPTCSIAFSVKQAYHRDKRKRNKSGKIHCSRSCSVKFQMSQRALMREAQSGVQIPPPQP